MSLAHRIIPTVLCRGRQLVKGKQFDSWRSVGVVAQAVRIHQSRGVDEVCLLDIAATKEGRGPNLALVEELTDNCFMPLAVGGGVRSVADVKALLRAGADKVVIGTNAPVVVYAAADIVGSQAIIASVDVKGQAVAWQCGQAVSALDPLVYVRQLADEGAGEILLTSIDREGTMQGYDLDLIRSVSEAVSIPVIAHGGCGSYEHMRRAIEAGASAVAAGAFFQFTDATPKGAAQHLSRAGIEVRL